MHLDLWVHLDSDLETEVQRLVALGARRVDWVHGEEPDTWCWPTPRATSSASAAEYGCAATEIRELRRR